MTPNPVAVLCTALVLTAAPVSSALADTVRAGGGLFGPILGGGIIIELGNNRKKAAPEPAAPPAAAAKPARTQAATPRKTVARPTISAAQRQENREVQEALNLFGFDVGAPDGIFGRKTRSGVSDYQKLMGLEATGKLTEEQRLALVAAHARAVEESTADGAAADKDAAVMQALLVVWRDEANAPEKPVVAAASVPATPEPVAAATVAVPAEPEPAAVAAVAVPAPATQPDPAALAVLTELPSFLGGGGLKVALSAHCNRIGVKTATQGRVVAPGTQVAATQALNEQFCAARSAAITQGEALERHIEGFTPQQIADQCAGFGPALKAQLAAIQTDPVEKVVADTLTFASATGMAPDQLSGTARICLSAGYRTDDLDVALASALILVAVGQGGYAELVGHHLAQGIGTKKQPELALGWFEHGLSAMSSGGTDLFAANEPGRADLLARAAFLHAGKPAPQGAATSVVAAAPGFTILSVDGDDDALQDGTTPGQAVLAMEQAAGRAGGKVGALPMAARLPFLLFRN